MFGGVCALVQLKLMLGNQKITNFAAKSTRCTGAIGVNIKKSEDDQLHYQIDLRPLCNWS